MIYIKIFESLIVVDKNGKINKQYEHKNQGKKISLFLLELINGKNKNNNKKKHIIFLSLNILVYITNKNNISN